MNDLISALRHTLYKTHDKSDACSGCVHAEAVLVEADRDPKALLPAELMAVVEAARLSVDNCGCGLPKPADVEALKFYIVEDEAGASEMCMSCLAILRALIAWDAVLDGSSGAPGNPASVSTLSSFSTTGAEEPSGTTPASPVPPVADLGPAEAQPARDPASDVHAGGGEPALCVACGHEDVLHQTRVGGTGCVGSLEEFEGVDCDCLLTQSAVAGLLPDYLSTLRDLSESVLGRRKP